MKRSNKKENKKNQEKKFKRRFVRARKKNAMKKWEFISKNRNSNQQNPQRVPSN